MDEFTFRLKVRNALIAGGADNDEEIKRAIEALLDHVKPENYSSNYDVSILLKRYPQRREKPKTKWDGLPTESQITCYFLDMAMTLSAMQEQINMLIAAQKEKQHEAVTSPSIKEDAIPHTLQTASVG